MKTSWKVAAVTVFASFALSATGTAAVAAPSAPAAVVAGSTSSTSAAVTVSPAAEAQSGQVTAQAKKKPSKGAIQALLNKIKGLASAVKKGYNSFKAWYDGLATWKKIAISALIPGGTLWDIWNAIYSLLS